MIADPALDDGRRTIGETIEDQRADPTNQRMMADIAERTARLRQKYEGIDVTTVSEEDWGEWLSVHHYAERDRAKDLRAQHRHKLKLAARAAGQPWKPNDPRARASHG